jgi:hypothetical protein
MGDADLKEFKNKLLALLEASEGDCNVLLHFGQINDAVINSLRAKVSPETIIFGIQKDQPSVKGWLEAHDRVYVCRWESAGSSRLALLITLVPDKKALVSVYPTQEEELAGIVKEAERVIETALFNDRESSSSRLLKLRLAFQNLPYVLRDWGNDIERFPEDSPVVICSAGPSLSGQLEMLRQYQDRLIIVAVGRVADLLGKADVKADFIIDIDPECPHLDPADKDENSIVVSIVTGSQKIPAKYSRVLWGFGDCHEINCLLSAWGVRLRSWAMSMSVTVTAIDFARKAGAGQIVLLGSDLCLSESGSAHAGENSDALDSLEFEVDAKDGGRVRTNKIFDGIRISLQNYLLERNLKIFNCTVRGAEITNAEGMDFAAFCQEFARKNIAEVKFQAADKSLDKSEIFQEIFNKLKEYSDNLTEMLQVAEDLKTSINKQAPDEIIADGQKQLEVLCKNEERLKIEEPVHSVVIAIEDQFYRISKEKIRTGWGKEKDEFSDFMFRYKFVSDTVYDFLNDMNSVLVKDKSFNVKGDYFRRFSGFKKLALTFIAGNNPEFADYLASLPLHIKAGNFSIFPNLQHLPGVKMIRPDGQTVPIADIYSMEENATRMVNNFVKDFDYQPTEHAVVFWAPGNWMYVTAFVRRFPTASIVVVEPWIELFAEMITKSMFLHLLPEDSIVIGADPALPNWKTIYQRKLDFWQQQNKKILYFEHPVTWSFPEIRKTFRQEIRK